MISIAAIFFRAFFRIHLFYITEIQSRLNRLYCSGMGIHFGKGLKIWGNCSLKIDRRAHVTIGKNFRLVSSNLINPLCKYASCISVGRNAILQIGDNVGMSSPTIWVRKSLIIKNNVNIGGGVVILDSDAHSLNFHHRRDGATDMKNRIDKEIVIEDDVLIGMNSIILKGVHIGARSVIGAGSVVTKDIPADCIAAGNPARVIKMIDLC